MKNRTCEICEEWERLRLRAKTKKPFVQFLCAHGVFALCGPVLKTRREVDQLARELKRHLGLSKTPGPKPKEITYMDIARAYAKIPGAGLLRLAEELDVSPKKIQAVLKRATHTFTSFKAEFFNKTRRDKSHLIVRLKPRKLR